MAMMLRGTAPFAALSRRQRAVVSASATFGDYGHGEQLFQAGDVCSDAIVTLSGSVRLFRLTPHGMDVTTTIISPGGMVTITALRNDAVHSSSAEAIGHVRTIETPLTTFMSLAMHDPAFFEEVAAALLRRTDDTYTETTIEAHEQLSWRILHILRKLARPMDVAREDRALLPLKHRLSHADIARLAGANRSSVTRALHELEALRLVQLRRGHVTAVRMDHGSANTRILSDGGTTLGRA